MSLYCSFNKYINDRVINKCKKEKEKTKNEARNKANIKKQLYFLSKSIWSLSIGKQKVGVWRDSTKNLPRPIW